MSSRQTLFVAVALLALLATPVSGTAESGIVDVSFGETVQTEKTGVYLWQSEPNEVQVTFTLNNSSSYYELCLHKENGDTVSCQSERVSGSGTVENSLAVDDFEGFNRTENVTVVLTQGVNPNRVVGSRDLSVRFLRKEGDVDGDRLTNLEESRLETNIFIADTDKDGLDDGEEVRNYNTSPVERDTDGDGLPDGYEILSANTSATDPDTDGDGVSDLEERQKDTQTSPATTTQPPIGAPTDGERSVVVVGLAIIGLVASATLLGVFTHSYVTGEDGSVVDWFDDRTPESETADVEPPESTEFESPDDLQTGAPQSFLSDEDRVIQILRDNGGWAYQSDVVDETGWSKSKVSRKLSELDDTGEIEKIPVGRQNVVAESGSLPSGFTSPFDEEEA